MKQLIFTKESVVNVPMVKKLATTLEQHGYTFERCSIQQEDINQIRCVIHAVEKSSYKGNNLKTDIILLVNTKNIGLRYQKFHYIDRGYTQDILFIAEKGIRADIGTWVMEYYKRWTETFTTDN